MMVTQQTFSLVIPTKSEKHFQGTNFCGSIDNRRRPVSEFIYNLVVGWVYIFDIIHVKEGPTRLKHAAYYLLIFIETAALMAVWYTDVHAEVPCLSLN